MRTRFDYSERIDTKKLIASIKELIELGRGEFKFDIACKNDYIVSIRKSKKHDYNCIDIFERDEDGDFIKVRWDFFKDSAVISELQSTTSNFNYSDTDTDKMLSNAILLVKHLYLRDQVSIIF